MVEFYDIGLFSRPIKFEVWGKSDFFAVFQIYLNISGRYIRVVILQEGREKSDKT